MDVNRLNEAAEKALRARLDALYAKAVRRIIRRTKDFWALLRAIERGEEMRGHLRTNCLKWDFDRIALMDKVIIQTALAEILSFPEIPLNVSINEYVEIAKNYSTPKSGAFVNGQLDNICKRLNKERILMKISTKKKVTRTTGNAEE